MSGICGIFHYGKSTRLDSTYLSNMLAGLKVQSHEEGVITYLDRVGMGIQQFPGLLSGMAKMVVHSHPIVLAFQGSFYNLKSLFPQEWGDVDSAEKLLRLYLEEQIAFVQRLQGEFALAIWDGREERLYLATDRFRVRPLFYYSGQKEFVFSSHMKGILICPLTTARTINPEAIVDIVSSSFIPTPKTIFNEIQKLPPGHLLTCHKGQIQVESYWDISFLETDGDKAGLGRKLKDYFSNAISARLNADAPDRIGTFLSGGVDSSTVTGVLTQLTQHPIKSFSIGFGEEKFNEISYSRIAAQFFGSQHFEYFVTPRDTYEAVPILLEAFDEPFANASAIPTYFCARMAHEQGIETLYAGDGGDELFAGNERYATQRSYDYYHRIPGLIRDGLLHPAISVLANRAKIASSYKRKKICRQD